MSEPTLMVLAAGMGGRYGGLKQIDPMGPNGELIIDYSVYDAVRAGFKKVVFLIAPKMREEFEEVILKRMRGSVEVVLAYQEPSRFLPEGFIIPEERKKPWGTAHAVLCCKDVVDGPFAMINSDDYYGPSAFEQIYSALKGSDENAEKLDFSMVGYLMGNTVTDHGKVARGVCVAEGDQLKSVIERTYVVKTPEGPAYSLDGGATLTHLPADSVVSMNFWGFTHPLFAELERRFPVWLETELAADPVGAEIYIPNIVGKLLAEDKCTVKLMSSHDKWYGVTYREDKPFVAAAFKKFLEEGRYPANLWG